MPAYDPDNIFARILRGEMSCHKVFEDEVALSFMDVMPRVAGHVLVIPKAPSRGLLDARPEDLAALMPRVRRVGAAVTAAMKAEGLTVHQFNEPAGGQVVFHLHFHLLPRHSGVALRPPGGPTEKPEVLAELAERIRTHLPA